jgi:hypothetical protein
VHEAALGELQPLVHCGTDPNADESKPERREWPGKKGTEPPGAPGTGKGRASPTSTFIGIGGSAPMAAAAAGLHCKGGKQGSVSG